VKKENDAGYLVKLNQVATLAPKLARAKEVPAARGECPTSSRNIESIESRELERVVQKLIRLLL
jgi:hypothetical protein